MLKTPLQLIVSILTFGLFVATLILYIQEAQIYVPDEEKFWKSESWNFWPKEPQK